MSKSEPNKKVYTCTHLLSLSVFSVMSGIQWLITYGKRMQTRKKVVNDTRVFSYTTEEQKTSPFLWTSCCWQSRQCKSHLPASKTNTDVHQDFTWTQQYSATGRHDTQTDLGDLLKQLLICLLCLCRREKSQSLFLHNLAANKRHNWLKRQEQTPNTNLSSPRCVWGLSLEWHLQVWWFLQLDREPTIDTSIESRQLR